MTTRAEVARDVAQCYVDNSWLCGQYWSDYRPELTDATVCLLYTSDAADE